MATRRPARRATRTVANLEKMVRKVSSGEHYFLCLYITGTTQRSARAIANIRALCEEFLKGRYQLDVIDIYQFPVETINAQIVAAPTLIKKLPLPVKRLVGDLTDRNKLIHVLDLQPEAGTPDTHADPNVPRL